MRKYSQSFEKLSQLLYLIILILFLDYHIIDIFIYINVNYSQSSFEALMHFYNHLYCLAVTNKLEIWSKILKER